LLFAISARRQLSWRSFSEVLDEIFVPDGRVGTDVKQVRSAVAALGSSLGHWDVIPEGQSASIYIAPPAFAVLPRPGLPTAVLCGSRSPDTLAVVTRAGKAAGVIVRQAAQEHLHSYAATRIEITADSHDPLERLADMLSIGYSHQPAASALAIACGSITDYVAFLPWCTDADLNWLRRDFDPEHLRFVSRPEGATRDGLVLSAYEHPSGWARQERLWRGDQSAIADRDWGRFAVLADRGINVYGYDHTVGTVSVPRQVPLPTIPARALGLCSGRPPRVEPGEGLGSNIYADVPAAIARTLAGKLGQHCDLLANQGDGERS
jgi:hypothetical protein